jgi:hypothetical protein
MAGFSYYLTLGFTSSTGRLYSNIQVEYAWATIQNMPDSVLKQIALPCRR